MSDVEAAKALVADRGYTVVKTKSFKAAQLRQGRAEMRAQWAEREAAGSARWANDCLTEERRLRERLVFVYGVARAHGATVEELAGDTLPGEES